MKIEQYFRLSISDEVLDLTGKELKNIATKKVNPTYIVEIKEHKFPLTETEYRALRSNAASLIPKLRFNTLDTREKVSSESIKKVLNVITEEWQTKDEIVGASGLSKGSVYRAIRQLHKDGTIINRKNPRNRKSTQHKLKVTVYRPDHSDEVEKVVVVEEPIDLSDLKRDKILRRNAQREI